MTPGNWLGTKMKDVHDVYYIVAYTCIMWEDMGMQLVTCIYSVLVEEYGVYVYIGVGIPRHQ